MPAWLEGLRRNRTGIPKPDERQTQPNIARQVSKDHAEILALADEQSGDFNIRTFCYAVGQRLGITLELRYFDPVEVAARTGRASAASTDCSDTGFFTLVEDPEKPGGLRAVIGYARNATTPEWMQEGIIAHEVGHLLDEFRRGFSRQAAKGRLVQAFAPTLLELGIGTDAVLQILGRTTFQSEDESRAESFAGVLRARVSARSPQAHGGLLGHMEKPLIDPFGGRRGG
ncbi:hypothetical protein ACWDRB_47625 [Nonomuraea sp. NPDC003707]